jgi:hypothetical protein
MPGLFFKAVVVIQLHVKMLKVKLLSSKKSLT